MAFLGLQLETRDLTGMAEFYVNRLGLTLLEGSSDRLDLQAGQTKLGFVLAQGDTQPAYRFALNLPQTAPGQGLSDPVGNRVDVTADSGQDSGVVRLTLPVDDVEAAARFLQDHLELAQAAVSAPEPDTRLLGDDGWSFLLVPDGANAYWVSASVAARIISETKMFDYPYYIYRWHR